jgi:hypothetical protein
VLRLPVWLTEYPPDLINVAPFQWLTRVASTTSSKMAMFEEDIWLGKDQLDLGPPPPYWTVKSHDPWAPRLRRILVVPACHTATTIPFLGIARPQPQFSTFVCLWAIYIFPGSVHIFPPGEKADPSWEYIIRSRMNVEIGAETPIYLFWEYWFQIFGILSLQWGFSVQPTVCNLEGC